MGCDEQGQKRFTEFLYLSKHSRGSAGLTWKLTPQPCIAVKPNSESGEFNSILSNIESPET